MHVDENSKSFVDVISTNLSPKPYVDVTPGISALAHHIIQTQGPPIIMLSCEEK